MYTGVAPFYNTSPDGTFNVGPALTLTLSGGSISGPGAFNKTGFGTLIISAGTNNAAAFFDVNGGILQINSQLGGGDPTITAAGNTTGTGGTLQFNYTGNYTRPIQASAAGGFGIDVTATNTITLQSLALGQNAAILTNNTLFPIIKTGAGTLVVENTGTGVVRTLTVANGTYQSNNNLPWDTMTGSGTTTVNLYGGTILDSNTTAPVAITTPTGAITLLDFGGGGHLSITSAAGFTNAINAEASAALNFARVGFGTLVIDTTGATLGGSGAGGYIQIAPTNIAFINGGTLTPIANVVSSAGILSPLIVAATGGVADFVTNTSNGLTALGAAPSGAGFFTTSTAASVGNLTTDQAFNGTGSVFALKVSNNQSGTGTIYVSSLATTTAFGKYDVGGILLNGNVTVANNFVFDPNAQASLYNGVSIAPTNAAGNLVSITGLSTASGSNSATVNNPAGLFVGMTLGGNPSLAAGTTISAINGNTITLSANAAGTAVGQNAVASNASTVSGASGEALVYVEPTDSATMSGAIFAQAFTKYGSGNLTLSATHNDIVNSINVQEGTLFFGSGMAANGTLSLTGLTTSLFVNNQGIVDLNGQNEVHFAQINNTFSGTANVEAGGIITDSGAASRLVISGVGASTATTGFQGQISGNLTLVRAGTGTTILGEYTNLYPNAGNNSYTGGTEIDNGATLTIRNPLNLGGANNTTPGAVNLYGGTLNLNISGASTSANNGVIIIGNQASNGIPVNLLGNATISVNPANTTASTGDALEIGSLTLAQATLSMTGSGSYRLLVDGTTSLSGNWASINSTANGPSAEIQLAGPITGSGTLYKLTSGTTSTDLRALSISGTNNTFTGNIVVKGTDTTGSTVNDLGNQLQITANSGNPIGTGTIYVLQGAELRVAGGNSLGSGNLVIGSGVNSWAMVGLDNSFDPGSTAVVGTNLLTSTNFSSAYGEILNLTVPFFNTNLNLSQIGNGQAFLSSGTVGGATESAYVASYTYRRCDGSICGRPLPACSASRRHPARRLRFSGQNNVLSGNGFLQIGPVQNNIVGTITGTGGTGTLPRILSTEAIARVNGLTVAAGTIGTQIARGMTVNQWIEHGDALGGLAFRHRRQRRSLRHPEPEYPHRLWRRGLLCEPGDR